MTSPLREISKLRKGASFVIDRKNSNRYRIVAIEPNRTKTAYYFSSPIYNIKTRKMLDLKFHFKDNIAYTTGSNANITVSDKIVMQNPEGYCVLSLANCLSDISENEIFCGSERIYPTTNGVAIRSLCTNEKPFVFTIEINKPFLEIRANDKYFALMSEHFRPFVTVSCIGTLNNNNIIAPAKISYQKLSDKQYILTVLPCSTIGKSVLIEANLYETKLFQDTTVESENTQVNNAFGSIGFIGTTKEYGEQWLYARPDLSKLTELDGKKIVRAIVHIPQLSGSSIPLTAWRIATRFCSFGSTWENKKNADGMIADVQAHDNYIDLEVTATLADNYGKLSYNEGFILRPKNKNHGFSVLSTGDSHLHPQILEINYM